MIKPLPCPFCGNEPITGPTNPQLAGNAWGFVLCVSMACPAQPQVNDGESINDDRGADKYIEAAIIRWNTRNGVKPTNAACL